MEQILKPNPLDGEIKMLLKIQFSVPRSQVGEFFKRGGGADAISPALPKRVPDRAPVSKSRRKHGLPSVSGDLDLIWQLLLTGNLFFFSSFP